MEMRDFKENVDLRASLRLTSIYYFHLFYPLLGTRHLSGTHY
jgi:hypothetical protein